jgi:hypothetical protein
MVLVFGFITCGIYHIFWCSKRAREINAFLARETISPTTAALSACCLPVSAYTLYVFGQSLPTMQRAVGIEPRDKSGLLIVLGIFIPMAAAMIVQQELNQIWDESR